MLPTISKQEREQQKKKSNSKKEKYILYLSTLEYLS